MTEKILLFSSLFAAGVIVCGMLGCLVPIVGKAKWFRSPLRRLPLSTRIVLLILTVSLTFVGATKTNRTNGVSSLLGANSSVSRVGSTNALEQTSVGVTDTARFLDIAVATNGTVSLVAHRPPETATVAQGVVVVATTNLCTPTWFALTNTAFAAGETNLSVALSREFLAACAITNLGIFSFCGVGDSDTDGLDNWEERFLAHTNPASRDTDEDGLLDGWEYDMGLDPLSGAGDDGAAADPDWDGLSNIWEMHNGTDPRNEDADGDMLVDGVECGWIEDGVTNIPWFTVQPILNYAPTVDTDRALIGCALPFTNRLAGCLIDTALADVNGVVYFGRPDATNSIYSIDNGPNLSEKQNKLVATVAAYWSDLKMRATLGSSIIFGTAAQDATNRFFVIEYRDVGTYSGSDNRISLQMSIPESEPNLVYVRYGAITDSRSSNRVSIGAQGAKVGSYANTPLLNHYYESKPPILAAGWTLAFHFGEGSDPLVADTDEDGLDDRVEYVIGTNPRKTDTDGDGFDDQEEIEYGMSPVSAVGADGADGDFDGDGLPNAQEAKFGTLLNVSDCDGDGIPDGEETGYIAVSNDLPWLTFDRYEDCTTDLVYQTHSQYHVNRGLPCALTIQGELVTNITFTSRGWLFLNKAGLGDEWRGNSSSSFTSQVDEDTLAIAAYGSSMSVLTNVAERSTVVRYGTATHGGVGYVVVEYDNLYYQLTSSATNSISFQIALPTNTADRVCVRYRDVTGTYMDGRNCGIGMQTFGGKWLHSYCYCTAGKVYEGLGLQFLFGRNTVPLERDSDGDGIADGEELELGTSPCLSDTDGDGLPDGWERDYELDPLSADGEDGACGDADGDGLTNIQEQTHGADPCEADTDGDGLNDGREVTLGTGVATADTDGDGLTDGDEDTRGTNPNAADSDGDGLSDGWEVANSFNPLTPSGTTGEASADIDGDGLTNLQEMQNGTNPRLADTDGDEISDSVELTLGTSPTKADTDGDGLNDKYENDTTGLDPLRPDSDRDGMPDGWEVANNMSPTSATGADGADGDLDGDGLPNLDEYRNNCNPRSRDTDGDGVSDSTEVTNGSNPADASDCGVKPSDEQFRDINFNINGDWAAWDLSIVGQGPNDYRTIYVTMGAPNAPATTTVRLRKNNTYRLSMQWLNCDGHDGSSVAPWYCWQAQIDGKPSVQTFDDYSSTRKAGVANLVAGTGWIAENEDGLLTAHIHENSEECGNVAAGRTALLHVFDIEHDLLWETDNTCNQIRNDTPKDDSSGNFDCEKINLGNKACSFAAHRNFLYLVASTNNKFRVTERVKVDSTMRAIFDRYAGQFLCAVFRSGQAIDDSQAKLSAANLEAAIEFDGPDTAVAEELQLRMGIDADGDGELGYDESTPLEVCKIRGNAAYAMLKAISKTKYEKHQDAIRSKVYFAGDDPPACIAPHARSFLKLFYDPDSTSALMPSLRPTGVGTMQFDAFSSDTSCFAEWLTHNCGASYSESGLATIKKYSWNDESAVSLFMSQRTPFVLKTAMTVGNSYCECLTDTGRRLLDFYISHVKASATEALQNAEDGTEVTMPLNGGWYEQSALVDSGVFTSLSPCWVPGMTLNVGSSSNYGGYDALFVQLMTSSPAFDDFDAFGTIGRGRVLNPRYRFVVKKVVPWIGMTRYEVVRVQFTCAIEDLYDFNYEDGDLPANAAALQIGFREMERNSGEIYSHHVDISATYSNPFSLVVRRFPGGSL